MRLSVALTVGLALAFAGCGEGDRRDGPLPEVSLALDFTPNAVHAPIYAAVREGLDRRSGVRLRIRTPGQSPDSLRDVMSGTTDMAILDIHDLGLAVVEGKDVVGVGALVQRPLAALVTAADVERPRELEGRRVGVSGLPSDPAVLDAVMRHDRGDHRMAELVTIGFTAVQSLISGRVAAVPVFWNSEGVLLRRRGVDVNEFRVDEYGAPSYPEMVVVTRRQTLARREAEVRAVVEAIGTGIARVRADPDAAVADIVEASGADEGLVRAQLRAVEPVFGTRLDRAVLEEWARWDFEFGILPRQPDVDRAFAPPPS